MRFALDEVIKEIERNRNVACEVVYGPSGMLTSQIVQGAPFDIFISADPDYLDKISKLKNTEVVSKRKYINGKLAIWSKNTASKDLSSLLLNKETQRIAIANPKIAPYGRASIEYLANIGILDSIRSKIVYGNSVSQVNQFVISGNVDMAITAFSSQLDKQKGFRGLWQEIPSERYTPITHSIMVLQKPKSNSNTLKLYNYLLSDSAAEILSNFGYSIID
ncbi:MAG: molybdate ABC transporter substrate-binding protein [Chitinophagales bacterium]|nr:molybdate ABC transporter substrate-binding protein [Chitinophagales bacterium]